MSTVIKLEGFGFSLTSCSSSPAPSKVVVAEDSPEATRLLILGKIFGTRPVDSPDTEVRKILARCTLAPEIEEVHGKIDDDFISEEEASMMLLEVQKDINDTLGAITKHVRAGVLTLIEKQNAGHVMTEKEIDTIDLYTRDVRTRKHLMERRDDLKRLLPTPAEERQQLATSLEKTAKQLEKVAADFKASEIRCKKLMIACDRALGINPPCPLIPA